MAMAKQNRAGLALACVAAVVATTASALVIAAPGSEGARLIASGGGVTATFLGSAAFFENRVYLDNGDDDLTNDRLIFDNRNVKIGDVVDLGEFEAGQELVLRLDVVNNATSFRTGPGTRNHDGLPHARVQAEWRPGRALVSFEDLYDGPLNYDDFSIAMTNVTVVATTSDAADAGPVGGLTGALTALARWMRAPGA